MLQKENVLQILNIGDPLIKFDWQQFHLLRNRIKIVIVKIS